MSKEDISFEMIEHLNNDEVIAEYLSKILKDGNIDEFMAAIGHLARIKGMCQIADETGLGRQSLYKAFNNGAKPRFDTVDKVLRSLGLKFFITA